MDPRLRAIAHADHPIAAPLDPPTVDRLVDRAIRRPDAHLLDLGCGQAAWLVRALVAHPGATAVGVDLADANLAVARVDAARLGVADRLTLVTGDAALHRPDRPADVVLCVGSTHAFGGLVPALAAAGERLADGGALVVGDGFWERSPTEAVRTLLEDGPSGYADLAGTVARVTSAGWTPVYGHVSTPAEWDDYEWSWTGSLTRWALDHPDDPDHTAALSAAQAHRDQWLGGYRGVLGFVTLVLRRTP